MKNIANADRPKSVGAMLPPRPLRRSRKVAQTACNSDRREGKSCIPTLNQTFADSRILKISKFPTFRIAGGGMQPVGAGRLGGVLVRLALVGRQTQHPSQLGREIIPGAIRGAGSAEQP